jgi:putative Holliday junction resolvase
MGIATPRPPLAASGTLDKDADALAAFAKREEVDAVVIGIPVMENAPDQGKQQRVCAMLADRLVSRGLTVHTVDESLTSIEAEDAMFVAGLKASERAKRRDGEAAARILERFMSNDAGANG